MEWVRGGEWQVSGDVAHVEVPLLLDETIVPEPDSMGWAYAEAKVEFVAARFFDDPDEWERRIGVPTGLQRYILRSKDRQTILQAFGEAVDDPEAEFNAFSEKHGAEILALLKKYGPLRPLLGVVGARQSHQPRGHLDLNEYYQDLVRTSWAWEQVNIDTTGRRYRRERVFDMGREYIYDVRVVPELTDDAFRYRVYPASLACFLWSGIMESLRNWPEGRCRYCGREFERPARPGRPPEYCERHRSRKFRGLVMRGRALIDELPSIEAE